MKPILIFSASISAVAMAMCFAVLADQAVPRRAVDADPVRTMTVAREAPDLTTIIRREAAQVAPVTATPVAAAPVTAVPESTIPESPVAETSVPAAADLAPPTRMSLLPPAAQATQSRPATRPTARVSQTMALDLAQVEDTAPQMEPIAASRFEYIPLIGVYR